MLLPRVTVEEYARAMVALKKVNARLAQAALSRTRGLRTAPNAMSRGPYYFSPPLSRLDPNAGCDVYAEGDLRAVAADVDDAPVPGHVLDDDALAGEDLALDEVGE